MSASQASFFTLGLDGSGAILSLDAGVIFPFLGGFKDGWVGPSGRSMGQSNPAKAVNSFSGVFGRFCVGFGWVGW